MMMSDLITPVLAASAAKISFLAILIIVLMIVLLAGFLSRYKKCPSDAVMVIYGKTSFSNRASKCIHGGAAFVFPVIQDYGFLSLRPMQHDIAQRISGRPYRHMPSRAQRRARMFNVTSAFVGSLPHGEPPPILELPP